MRDLMFMLAPVVLVYPDQFSSFLGWAGRLLH
jgi:hypothetical protein